MADAETELKTFVSVISALKNIYLKAKALKQDDMIQFISKKFGKHLLRKDVALLERKKTVIRTISEIKDENYVPELVSLLWDPGTFVEARAALISLSEFSMPVLIATLNETENRAVRMKIIDVIIKMGERAVPEVQKLLDSSEWYIRRNGIFILGEMKTSVVIDRIGPLIDDDEEQVQLAVIASLMKTGGENIKSYLLKGLQSKYNKVVIAAMKYLEKEDVLDRLTEVAGWLKSRKGIPDIKEEQFRQEIIGVLGRFGDDSVLEPLVAILSERPIFKADLLHPTKRAVLNSLVKIGSEKTMGALREATNHKDQFVAATAEEIINRLER